METTAETPTFRSQPVQRTWLKNPADIAVYGGSAGGGKTWALLYKPIFSRHHLVPGFTGVIFRRTYPEITVAGGLWDESLGIYPHFGGIPRYGDLSWTFPSGATIEFRHLQHEQNKYQWQGAQVCCQEETLVEMGGGGFKPVRDIEAGDEVMTLEGPRRVMRVGNRRLEECVKATVCDSSWRCLGNQIHSETHALLTPYGWISYADMCDGFHPSLISSPTESLLFHRSSLQSWTRSDIERRYPSIPAWDRGRRCESRPRFPGHRSGPGSYACEGQRDRGIDCGWSGCGYGGMPQHPSATFPVVLRGPSLPLGGLSVLRQARGHGACDGRFGSSPEDCRGDCSADLDPCDGRSRREAIAVRSNVRQPTDAEGHIPRHCSLGDAWQTRKCTCLSSQYIHPYTMDVRQSSVSLVEGTCVAYPCGVHWVVDLTVADSSHYCTKNGLSNKNCYFGFDELSHFTEGQFTYVALSRGRSTCGVRPYVRGTCNPDPGWLKTFLAPWVDKECPAPASSGEVRNFVRDAGVMRWVDPGHPDSKSLSFTRASVYDNAELLRINPGYIANLKALLPVERARLLDGDWDVRREGLVYPEFGSCVVDVGTNSEPDVGGIDYGFSNPFAAVWGHLDYDGVLWITGVRYVRQATTPIHAEAIPRGVRYWCDPAQPESRQELRNAGHDVVPCVHIPGRGASGEKRNPKLHGIDLVSERIRTGRLKVLRSECMPLIREAGMYHYPDDKQSEEPVKEDDHAMDALRYLIVGLDRGTVAPAPEVDPAVEVVERVRQAKRAREEAEAREALARGNLDDDRLWQ